MTRPKRAALPDEPTGQIPVRNVALAGHRSAGKTSLGELLLATAGATRTAGSVDAGTSLLDHLAEEQRKHTTLKAGIAWLEWRGTRIELIDVPGADGLAHEAALALAMTDSAILVISAPDGVQLGTRRALEEAERAGVGRMAVITRIDRPANLDATLKSLQAAAGDVRIVPMQIPMFEEARATGVLDLWDRDVPDRYKEAAQAAWDRLAESVALSDDGLLERYLEDLELDRDVVRAHLGRAIRDGAILPVYFTSATAELGASSLLDAIVEFLPSPQERRPPRGVDADDGEDVTVAPGGPFVAQVLATRLDDDGATYRVLRVWAGEPPRRGDWVHAETGATHRVQKLYAMRGPRTSAAKHVGPGSMIATWDPLPGRPGDTFTDGPRWLLGAPPPPPPMVSVRLVAAAGQEDRLAAAIATLAMLDPALDVTLCELTGTPVIGGLGQDHIDRAYDTLVTRLGAHVAAEAPLVPYREAPSGAVAGITGIHRRGPDGNEDEYGMCEVSVAPATEEFRFAAEVTDEQIPARFLAAVERGARAGLRHGPIAGYPVGGVDVVCTGGAYDMLVSTEDHLALASERAVRTALEGAGTRLLEPWWRVEICVPAEEVGPILAEVAARRGRIHGLEVDGREATVFADCPYRELRGLGPRLQALTGGRGRFTGYPSHYDPLPTGLVRDAVAASPFLPR